MDGWMGPECVRINLLSVGRCSVETWPMYLMVKCLAANVSGICSPRLTFNMSVYCDEPMLPMIVLLTFQGLLASPRYPVFLGVVVCGI
jgi:hypothetical protein